MARERISVQMLRQIQTLEEKGYSIRAIARCLKMSRKTVRKVFRAGREDSLETATAESGESTWESRIPWETLRKAHTVKGVTVQQLHREYAPDNVNYVRFWRALRRQIPVVPQVTIRLHHKPGERTQMDFTDGISIVDRRTGKKRKTHLFAGCLAFSSYLYGEFVWDQKLPTFLCVQDRMWHFFGGITPYAVIDNLKSGVSRADWYDPDLNPTYCEYANHMGFAVLPARPYRPRDKGKTESQIGVIQRGFYQEVRNRTFYSLEELNRAFGEYLHRLNRSVMKDYGISRWDRFQEEQKLLQSLPPTRFEVTEWRQAKVHPDCHVQVEKNFYSVPYPSVGHVVRIRLSVHLLEVFTEDSEPLAVHTRLKGTGRFSTIEAHYPEAKLAAARFDLCRAKQEAERIGPKTQALVEHLLEQSHPLRFLRRVQGILRLWRSKQMSREALEYASHQAMTFGNLRLAYLTSCARYFAVHGRHPSLVSPTRQRETLYLHQEPVGGSS